jgi:threonine/homoserine/homoserine lactone efflux protein
MPIELWLAFVAASAILLIIPGPTILTVISYSMSHGRRANVPLVAAVALGDSTALVVSLLGLGALLATSAFWFTAVKWVGGLYLLYLGYAVFAGSARKLLASPRAQRRFNLAGGSLLSAAGFWALMARRPV